jgi:hypothetical protein
MKACFDDRIAVKYSVVFYTSPFRLKRLPDSKTRIPDTSSSFSALANAHYEEVTTHIFS